MGSFDACFGGFFLLFFVLFFVFFGVGRVLLGTEESDSFEYKDEGWWGMVLGVGFFCRDVIEEIFSGWSG